MARANSNPENVYLDGWEIETPVKDGKLVPLGNRMVPRRWIVFASPSDTSSLLTTRIQLTFEVTEAQSVVLAKIELTSQNPQEVDATVLDSFPLEAIKQRSAGFFYLAEDRLAERKIVLTPEGTNAKSMREALKSAELWEVAILYCREPTRGVILVEQGMGYGSRSTATARVKEARAQGLIPAKTAKPAEYFSKLEWLLDHNPDGSKLNG
jgi:hypothetical protein